MTNTNNKAAPRGINDVDKNAVPHEETRLQERVRGVVEYVLNACTQYITSNNQYYNQIIYNQALTLDAREEQLKREILDIVELIINQLLSKIDQIEEPLQTYYQN